MYLILQLCTGGELQDWLLRRSEQEPYTEQIAAKVAYDVLQVLACACTPTQTCAKGIYGWSAKAYVDGIGLQVSACRVQGVGCKAEIVKPQV